MWEEFATPAAALRYIKSEGSPSTLQQVQIERAAKISKARNGFEFSFEAPTGGATAKPPPKPAPTTAHTPSVASYVQVQSLSCCGSCRGRFCGVTTTCSQCPFPFFGRHQKINCPISSVFDGRDTILTEAQVHGAIPPPIPPPPPTLWQSLGNPSKKKPGCRYKEVCIHTHSFLIQTPNQSLKRWENATTGHNDEATNLQNIEFRYFEFLRLLERLSDTVRSLNLHHLGVYAIFLGNLRPVWGKFYTHLHNMGAGGRNACKPRKVPANRWVPKPQPLYHQKRGRRGLQSAPWVWGNISTAPGYTAALPMGMDSPGG